MENSVLSDSMGKLKLTIVCIIGIQIGKEFESLRVDNKFDIQTSVPNAIIGPKFGF